MACSALAAQKSGTPGSCTRAYAALAAATSAGCAASCSSLLEMWRDVARYGEMQERAGAQERGGHSVGLQGEVEGQHSRGLQRARRSDHLLRLRRARPHSPLCEEHGDRTVGEGDDKPDGAPAEVQGVLLCGATGAVGLRA